MGLPLNTKWLTSYGPYLLACLLLWAFSSTHPFFWDSLQQASRVAHWFYEQGLGHWVLPPDLDSGHPPFFGAYLSSCWQGLGKTLFVSHLSVLPFLLLIVLQCHALVKHYLPAHAYHWGMLFVLLDATLLAQFTLVAPDLVLLSGFLMCWNGQLQQRKRGQLIGALLIALISIRGLFVLAALGLFACWRKGNRGQLPVVLGSLGIGLLAALIYYSWHYWQTGWWLSTTNDAWGAHRGMASVGGMLRNVAVLGWRMLDVGRLLLWLVLFYLLVRSLFRASNWSTEVKELFGLMASLLLVFAPVFIVLNNPIGHRYLMPLFVVAGLLCARLLFEFPIKKNGRKAIAIAVIACQLSGHFWIYPKLIAQGWDASLAYLPYLELKDRMHAYLADHQIAQDEVGTAFPAVGPTKWIELDEGVGGMVDYDLSRQKYILYSNVFNDFTDETVLALEANWKPLVKDQKRGVFLILYEKQELDQ